MIKLKKEKNQETKRKKQTNKLKEIKKERKNKETNAFGLTHSKWEVLEHV